SGAGLAAVQIGHNIRIFLMKTHIHGVEVFINPIILNKSKEHSMKVEGCLSIPGEKFIVKRHKWLTLMWWDEEFKSHTAIIKGYRAEIVQHEMEHLSGELISDEGKPKKPVFENGGPINPASKDEYRFRIVRADGTIRDTGTDSPNGFGSSYKTLEQARALVRYGEGEKIYEYTGGTRLWEILADGGGIKRQSPKLKQLIEETETLKAKLDDLVKNKKESDIYNELLQEKERYEKEYEEYKRNRDKIIYVHNY
ncbi:MAG: peptide deformylase, partial [Thaumarchaeota archaeon]|nr:peptide deformylase [Nitrososphaerota archaeon]